MKPIHVFSVVLVLAIGLIVGFAISKDNSQVRSTVKAMDSISPQDVKEVMLVANKDNPASTDINALLNSGEIVLIATYDNLYRDHYHAFEYIDGDIYVIRRIGDPNFESDWTDQLWKVGLVGTGELLFSQQGIDFRVSPNKQLIAITDSTTLGQVFFINQDGTKLKTFSLDQLAIDPEAKGSEILSWSSDSKSFWGDVYFTDQANFFKISVADWLVKRYAFDGNLHNHDWDLNTDVSKVVYSDYPSFGDAGEAEEFDLSNTPTHLYITSFLTNKTTSVDSSVAKSFKPKWISNTEIQYNNPTSGELTTYTAID